MYDKLERKDVVDGGLQLEAEKDDGLNNYAPSLRYAVRRLICGVSSSRENIFVVGICSPVSNCNFVRDSLCVVYYSFPVCKTRLCIGVLTVLVGAIPSIKVDALLKLIVDLLEVSSLMKGQVGKSSFMFKVDFGKPLMFWLRDSTSITLLVMSSLVILLKFGGVVLFPEATLLLRVIQPNFIAAIERALCQVDTPYTIGVVHRDPDNGRMRFATVGTTAEGRFGNPPSYVGSSLVVQLPNQIYGGTLPNQPTIDRSADSHSYGGGSFANRLGRSNATKYPCYVPQNEIGLGISRAPMNNYGCPPHAKIS
ncbi:hypothetical protein LOK49_LG14G01210 [Camellia lanceoleosa]|uniref:Uncharacterized protein n=1 Tax=Camellia lanceoleosa TaxID=1840588 RepID=A0ACC0FCI2_9ERIC|nr:hypothetical protein LOK49_LG14G01210 [Camellia lanceoleosa]